MDDDRMLLLFAEDDNEDWMLIEEVLEECPSMVRYERVLDGEALIDRLKDAEQPRPDLVMLDLRMPRRDGFWALQKMQADDDLKILPVTVMTTSRTEVDVLKSYATGANAYIVKPPTFDELQRIFKVSRDFWEATRLPKTVPDDS
jgi:CheY-like chemotaxis protein